MAAPRIALAGPFTVILTGLETDGLTRPQWVAALTAMGRELQGEIANSFAREKVAGSSSLESNDPKYDARKARQGFDTRRGHRTNLLQSMLRPQASQLFTVTGPSKDGRAVITFKESKLHAIVPYAEYYEEMKVRREGILVLAVTWLRRTRQAVDAAQVQALAAKAEKAIKARVGAAKVVAGRARFIRPAAGLTQGVAGRVAGLVPNGAARAAERFLRKSRIGF